jgi:Rrf2 family transcriptional regulator, nitric oxide-sensitive transcriptional repressor
MHVKASAAPTQYHVVMRLADYTDYSLRVLMYCASNPDRLVTIAEIAEVHGVSKNHLMKIVNDLARQGVLETSRGRGGGIRLLKPASEIGIGDVVRGAETDFRLVECFDRESNTCSLSDSCRMKGLLDSALAAYFRELDKATLADIVGPPTRQRSRAGAGVVIPIAAAPQRATAAKRASRARS